MNRLRDGSIVGAILWLFVGVAAGGPLNPADYTPLGDLTGMVDSINTDSLTLSNGSSGNIFHGVAVNGVAVFTFNKIDSLYGNSYFIQGSRPLALLSYGDITISSFSVNGLSNSYYPGNLSPPGSYPGDSGSSSGPGGGGRGGAGTYPFTFPGGDGQRGSPDVETSLMGGSGNANDIAPRTGGGAGAIELGALGRVTISGILTANGGDGGGSSIAARRGGGGGGGGGGIFIHANSVSLLGLVSAVGGDGGPSGDYGSGGGGGGGRVVILAGDGGLDLIGSIDVSGGHGGTVFRTGDPGAPGSAGLVVLESTGPIRGSQGVSGDPIAPEPSGLVLISAGAVILLGSRRRFASSR